MGLFLLDYVLRKNTSAELVVFLYHSYGLKKNLCGFEIVLIAKVQGVELDLTPPINLTVTPNP